MNLMFGWCGWGRAEELAAQPVSLLVSYVYLKSFLSKLSGSPLSLRALALDSGAFSAYHRKLTISLEEYIDTCYEMQEKFGDTLTDIFSLDVIGDWRAGLKNTEKMHAAGIRAIPAYHRGEPLDVLVGLSRDYHKVGLGGVALQNTHTKQKWATNCFARVWPARIHGFGFGAESYMYRLPWDSLDSTNWAANPRRYGIWRSLGWAPNRSRSPRPPPSVKIHCELRHWLKVERFATAKWEKTMKVIPKDRYLPPFKETPCTKSKPKSRSARRTGSKATKASAPTCTGTTTE